MTPQWITSQVFAFIALIFVVISTQQKNTIKYIWFYTAANVVLVIGLCFLGENSALILCIAGIIRNIVLLYFAYHPNTKNSIKVVSSIFVLILIVVLNIIFWKNYFNLFSILIGGLLIVCFIQKTPSLMRKWMVFTEIVSIVYYALLMTPINLLIELFGFISAIIGIVRLDLPKNKKNSPTDNSNIIDNQ